MWDTAYRLNQTAGSAIHRIFGAANEFIIVNPLLTDANDWGVHLDRAQIESIRVNFVNAARSRSSSWRDQKNASALFTHDRIIYKLRHEWGLALAEFRAAAKAEVA